MKLFRCQSCGQVLYFENTVCERCSHRLGYLPDLATYYALPRSYCACARDRKVTNEFIVDPDEMEIG